MRQAGMVAREFAREFEQCAPDVGMAEEDAKVHLVSALNQDTLAHLDVYTTMCSSDKMARLETIHNRLRHIPYVQMLVYLKYGELSELAR